MPSSVKPPISSDPNFTYADQLIFVMVSSRDYLMLFIEEQRKSIIKAKPEVLILDQSKLERIAVIVRKLLIEKPDKRGRYFSPIKAILLDHAVHLLHANHLTLRPDGPITPFLHLYHKSEAIHLKDEEHTGARLQLALLILRNNDHFSHPKHTNTIRYVPVPLTIQVPLMRVEKQCQI